MRRTESYRHVRRSLPGFLVMTLSLGTPNFAQSQSSDLTRENIVVRGILLCLNPEGRETQCTEREHSFGLKDSLGKVYSLKTDKSLDTLRTEPRIRSKEFQLTLRPIQNSSLYEIVKSRFFRDGKLYDFYYYCEVCNITTYSPGLCMCCRQQTEYRENVVP